MWIYTSEVENFFFFFAVEVLKPEGCQSLPYSMHCPICSIAGVVAIIWTLEMKNIYIQKLRTGKLAWATVYDSTRIDKMILHTW